MKLTLRIIAWQGQELARFVMPLSERGGRVTLRAPGLGDYALEPLLRELEQQARRHAPGRPIRDTLGPHISPYLLFEAELEPDEAPA